MPTSVYFNNQGASREQILIEDMIIESIRNHGIDVYYVPRGSQSTPRVYQDALPDALFGDDPIKSFSKAYKFEMYMETFNNFEGNEEFFSKFGLEVQKSLRMAVARRTFERFIPQKVRNTPKEGDLVWLSVQQKLMEVKFVEQEENFFQLGKQEPYMHVLTLETFKYNGELINTGIPEIDNIADAHAIGVDYNLAVGGLGTYNNHEIVYQGATLASATAFGYVSDWDLPTRRLRLRNVNGRFTNGQAIKGVDSNATWTLSNFNTQQDATNEADDNYLIEQEADNILDWTETNPFGMPNE